MKKYKVYKRIAPDGRVYVGCTSQSLELRAGKGGCNYQTNVRLWKAIQKFGCDAFRTELILDTDNLEEAAAAELAAIEQHQATNLEFGFNSRSQSYITDLDFPERLSSAIKVGMTDDVRQRMSASMKEYYQSEENREFHRSRVHRVIYKPEVRLKLTEANRRNLAKPEVREKLRQAVKKYWTHERRQAHSALITERLEDEDTRRRISEGTKKGLASPETRQKMSEAQKTKWSDPEYHARTQAAMKAACNTEEHRKRVSEAGKIDQNRLEVKAKISAAFSGLVFINNGVKNRRVKEAEVEYYVATGNWVQGKLPMGPRGPIDKLKNRTWIHKDGRAIIVPGVELQSYLDSGWVQGRGKLKMRE